ncbi:Ribosomal RNA large subunit methyltransferase I [bioreactor metagenome]|uniref:Ribosomal RNA large subunit methyltransferase I n=1 Tax=bioreactor metagenome TaxID=1076179 RepID=A0A644XYV4_9ZZZZ
MLDCFTHTGSFALNALMGGAAHVTAVDVSQAAVELARGNAALNGLTERIDFVCADVFDLLPQLIEQRAAYDLIVLDPPAFTKSRKTIQGAERGYRTINYNAMKLLPRGGYLATCSCSHFMESDMFLRMLLSASREAGVSLKLVEARRQSPDHPTLMNVPETDYLKFYLFQVI